MKSFIILTFFALLVSINQCLAEGKQSFLELQRQLAEEQWKREQQAGGTDEVEEEEEYYVYYYDDSSAAQEVEAAENVDVQINPHQEMRRNNRGFKKPVSAGLTKNVAGYRLPKLVEEAKELTGCLKKGEEDPVITAYKLELAKLAKLRKKMKRMPGLLDEIEDEEIDKKPTGRKSYKERMEEKKKAKEEKAKKDKEEQEGSSSSARRSLKQRQEDKKQEKEDLAALKNLEKNDPGFLQEIDCETRICASCKATVEEFGNRVYQAINDPKAEYIYDLAEGFCESADISLKYIPLVRGTCEKLLMETGGYREHFVRQFELDDDWENVMKRNPMLKKKKEVEF